MHGNNHRFANILPAMYSSLLMPCFPRFWIGHKKKLVSYLDVGSQDTLYFVALVHCPTLDMLWRVSQTQTTQYSRCSG